MNLAFKRWSSYLHINNLKTIALYGVGDIGTHAYHYLKSSDFSIHCFIDRTALYGVDSFYDLPVIPPSSAASLTVDAILVCSERYGREIQSDLNHIIDSTVAKMEILTMYPDEIFECLDSSLLVDSARFWKENKISNSKQKNLYDDCAKLLNSKS